MADHDALATRKKPVAPNARVGDTGSTRVRTCLVVLGMHRSGTSALTRLLSLLGAELPATLMEGKEANLASNQAGHWESERIARLNDEILDSAGLSWRSPETVTERWYQTDQAEEFKQKARLAIEEEFGDARLFVLKDPRTCKLMPFWLDVLAQSGIAAKVVSIVRSPREVAMSLHRRNGIEPSLGELLWLHYVLAAEHGSRGLRRQFITYDALLRDWRREKQRIENALDIRLPRSSASVELSIDRFLSTTLRHHNEEFASAATCGTDKSVGEAYSILSHWAADREAEADQPQLDRMREDFESLLVQLGRPVYLAFEQSSLVQRLQKTRASLEAEKSELGQKADALTNQVGELGRRTNELTGRVQQLESEIPPLEESNASLAAERDELQHRAEKAEAERGAFEKQLAEEQSATDALRLEKHELATRINGLQTLLERSEGERERAVDTLDDYRQQQLTLAVRAAMLDQKSSDLRDQLADERGKFEQEFAALRNSLGDAERKRNALTSDLARQKAIADERQKAIEHLRQDRAERVAGRDEQIAKLRSQVALLQDEERRLTAEVDRLERYSSVRLFRRLGQLVAQSDGRRRQHELQLLSESPLFDPAWYLARYPDVAAQGLDPAAHYLDHGAMEGRSPSAAFHAGAYLKQYPDVANAGLNPLIHFIEYGQREGRKTRLVEAAATHSASNSLSEDEAILPRQSSVRPPLQIDESWLARDVAFVPLGEQLQGFTQLENVRADENERLVMLAGVCVAKADFEPDAADSRSAALDWMNFLSFEGALPAAAPVEDAVKVHYCNNAIELRDCWFASDYAFRMRFDRIDDAAAEPVLFRCFQRNADGKPELFAEALAVGSGSHFLDVQLESPFRPILLTLSDPAGALLDSGLVAFPSLARGGLHHAELRGFAAAGDGPVQQDVYAASLLRNLAGSGETGSPLAVRRLAVDLGEAIGIEPIFGAALLDWLVGDAGLVLETRNPTDSGQWLVEKIALANGRVAGRTPDRRRGGGTLHLPSTGVPSLGILFAGMAVSSGNAANKHIVADRLSNDALVEWTLPARTDLQISQRGMPALIADDGNGGRSLPEAPLAICFEAKQDSDARALFPVSPDATLSFAMSNTATERTVSVVVTGGVKWPELKSAIHSVSNQHGDFQLDLIMACEPCNDQPGLRDEIGSLLPVQWPDLSANGQWDRLLEATRLATGSKILFLDASVILHDPRTLDALWNISELPGIGSASCALTREVPGRKGQVHYSTMAGLLLNGDERRPDAEFVERGFPYSLLPPYLIVAANSPRCTMFNRSILLEMMKEPSDAEPNSDWLGLGLGLAKRGLQNLCVTSVVATCHGSEPDAVTLPREDISAMIPHIAAFRSFAS